MAVAGGMIVPHPPLILHEIGRGQEFQIQRTIDAYRTAAEEAAVMQPETVVILSPHSVMYRDYFHISPGRRAAGDFRMFGEPEVEVETEYDEEFVKALCQNAEAAGLAAGTEGERDPGLDHASMIPLRFLQKENQRFKTVRIGLSGLPFSEHYRLGQCIAGTAEQLDRRILVVASGDLSHRLMDSGPYDFAEEGPEYDKRVTEVMASGRLADCLDFPEEFCEKAGECGHRAFCILAGALEGKPLLPRLLSYEGPFGVGYAVAIFQDAFVALARRSLAYWLEYGQEMPVPDGLPKELLERRAGVFVSLKKDGELRGCIGTIEGVRDCIAREIIGNAVSAGIYDPRFPQVEMKELKEIICTVDVLSEAEPVDSEEALDPKRYGVIVTRGRRRGLLLPDLEGVDTPRQQIAIALRKAGIEADEPFSLERFEVVRHY